MFFNEGSVRFVLIIYFCLFFFVKNFISLNVLGLCFEFLFIIYVMVNVIVDLLVGFVGSFVILYEFFGIFLLFKNGII